MISACLRTVLMPSGRTSHSGRRSTNQRNVIAKALPVHFNQALTMAVFLRLHILKHFRRCGISLAQPFGEIAVDPPVFFFQLDRQRQNFLLAEILESLLGHDSCSLSLPTESIIISGRRQFLSTTPTPQLLT